MTSILQQFRALVAREQDKVALTEGDLRLTYGQLDRYSSALAHELRDAGLGPQSVYAFVKSGMAETYVAMLAGLKAGCGFVLPDVSEDPTKLSHLLDQADVTLYLTGTESGRRALQEIGREARIATLDDLDRDTAPLPIPPRDAIAFVEPTSGSTGLPKLVYSTQETVDYYTGLHMAHAGLRPEDRVGQLGEIWIDTVMTALLSGAELHAFDFKGKGAKALSRWMRDQRITAIQTYVAAFRAMAEATQDNLPDLRLVRLSGEAVLARDVAEFERICAPGAVLTNYFGATECGFITAHRHTHADPAPEGALPIGRPAEGTHLRVVDAAGIDMPQGAVGLLEFSAPHLPEGYLNNPEKTAETYPTDENGRRVLRSGDMGFLGDDGLFRMAGRSDDQVKIRGYSVRYSDVEAGLEALDSVAEAAVTSILSPRGTRQLVGHVLPVPGAVPEPADIRAKMKEALPNYMVPPHVMIHDHLPRTDTGKILRRALPDPLTAVSAPSWDDMSVTERAVADVWAAILGHGNFGVDEDFFDVGGDSLQAMSVVVALEDELRIRVGYETLIMEGASVGTIAARLDQGSASDVVVLEAKGNGKPLYIMPVENGEFSDWLYVLNSFVPDRPVIGVHARPQDQREVFPKKSVQDLAVYVADAILRHDAEGPHLIGGFSSGAQIAFEVAKVLEARGKTPGGVMLVDPPVTSTEDERHSWHVRRIMSPLIKRGDLRLTVNRAAHFLFGRPGRELAFADECSFWQHRPAGHIAVPVLYFSATVNNPAKVKKEQIWRQHLSGQVELVEVPDDHNALMRDPHAPRLAKVMERWMNKVSPP